MAPGISGTVHATTEPGAPHRHTHSPQNKAGRAARTGTALRQATGSASPLHNPNTASTKRRTGAARLPPSKAQVVFKRLDALLVPFFTGNVQRRRAVVRGNARISSCRQERFDTGFSAVQSGEVERRAQLQIGSVHVGPGLQECLQAKAFALRRHHVQSSGPVLDLSIKFTCASASSSSLKHSMCPFCVAT